MENTSISLRLGSGGSEMPPIRPGRNSSTGGTEAETPPVSHSQSASSDPKFLSKQLKQETESGFRDTYAHFIVNNETHDISVEIIDSASRQVVRTIPNVDLRKMAQNLRASNGFVLDSAV